MPNPEQSQLSGFRAIAPRDDAPDVDRLIARVVAAASAETGLPANAPTVAGATGASLSPGEAGALRYGPPGVPL